MSLSCILLVEESKVFLTIERQFLRTSRAELLEARSAADALNLCRTQRPHLAYISYELPDRNGAELCRQLKQDSRLGSIPVVMICDEKHPEQVHKSREAGSDGILFKPLDRLRFLEVGRSFLVGIREVRRTCLVVVSCSNGDTSFVTRGHDISSGGIFLAAASLLPQGNKVHLDIVLARPGQDGPRIGCDGIVAWHNLRENPLKPSHPMGFGVSFTAMSVADSGILSDFLLTLERG